MSGGIAYVYNPNLTLQNQANTSMIDLDPMDAESKKELLDLLTKHAELTGSPIAKQIIRRLECRIGTLRQSYAKGFKRSFGSTK